jgi:glycosyltransferase involved in cell wall biosynthesis
MSVIEAMGAGLAVVTTPVGATADIIHDGQTGLLVAPGDSAMLTDALEKVVRDKDLRERLSKSAHEFHHQHLEISQYARRLISIWDEAAQER